MPLPYLQSYNDPKKQKAYLHYMEGQPQRKLASALKISPRTIAHWSKADGWEDERQARKIAAAEAPNVAAVAAGGAAESETAATDAVAERTAKGDPETRLAGMERILARQQRLTGRLVAALEQDIDKTLANAEKTGVPLARAQVAQLTTLSNNMLAMERKAWCVPDKIETKDTTATPTDKVRSLSDEDLDRQLAAAEGTAAAAAQREAPKESVN